MFPQFTKMLRLCWLAFHSVCFLRILGCSGSFLSSCRYKITEVHREISWSTAVSEVRKENLILAARRFRLSWWQISGWDFKYFMTWHSIHAHVCTCTHTQVNSSVYNPLFLKIFLLPPPSSCCHHCRPKICRSKDCHGNDILLLHGL